MRVKDLTRLVLVCFLLPIQWVYAASLQQGSQQPINVLFIYTDDQAPWALGASGDANAVTPNLDHLAQQGMHLVNAYTTTPVCSPSRAGLLTSRYGYELGIDDWINASLPRANMSGLEPELGLDPSLTTWVDIFQQNGYATGLIGKWHLGEMADFHPNAYGYDEFVGFLRGGVRPENPTFTVNGDNKQVEGLTVDVITDYARDFISRHKTKPFVLSVHYRAPHKPWLPTTDADMAPFVDKTLALPHADFPNLDTKKQTRFLKEYLASVKGIDRNVGYIIDDLKRHKLWHNTLVVFTSDHGYAMGHNGIWHKGNGHWMLTHKVPAASKNIPPNQRPNLYDTVIKVPTIVVLPDVITGGETNPTTVSNLDWFPTLLAAAGLEMPKDTLIRGNNVWPVLSGKQAVGSSDYYVAYSTKHQSITGMRMYSDGRYKLLIDWVNPERNEFYNLTADPEESRNLYKSGQKHVQMQIHNLRASIIKKMRETDDPLLGLISVKE